MRGRAIGLTLALAPLLLAGCEMMAMQPKERSLYDRLGGRTALVAVVDDFTARMAADDRVNKHFAKTDIPKFKAHLVDQLCQVSGGPCQYTGRDMPTAHKGMNVTLAEFDITGGHLAATLDKFNVPMREKNEVLSVAGSLRDQIVGK
ncbi:MAG: group 1 truncated hemoglobin [Alphaproteobacteria bacterium]|nr:group 1 truncated hemoglobin [Alphaproteobacteria bacterium]